MHDQEYKNFHCKNDHLASVLTLQFLISQILIFQRKKIFHSIFLKNSFLDHLQNILQIVFFHGIEQKMYAFQGKLFSKQYFFPGSKQKL